MHSIILTSPWCSCWCVVHCDTAKAKASWQWICRVTIPPSGTAVRLNGTPSEEASQALLMGMELYKKYTHSHSSVFHLFVKHGYQCCHFDKVCDIMTVAGMRDRSVCYITSQQFSAFYWQRVKQHGLLVCQVNLKKIICVCFKFELFSATPWRAQVWSLPPPYFHHRNIGNNNIKPANGTIITCTFPVCSGQLVSSPEVAFNNASTKHRAWTGGKEDTSPPHPPHKFSNASADLP